MSQYPLAILAKKYAEMQTNGKLLSNRASIELVRERIQALAQRIDLNEAPDRLVKLHTLWTKFKGNYGLKDETRYRLELDDEFEKAYHDYAAWQQMFDAIDLDRKLVESEVKILRDIHATLNAEDAYELAAKLLAAVFSASNSMDVSDEVKSKFLDRIRDEFTRIVGGKDTGRTEGSGEEDDPADSGFVDTEPIHDPGNQE